MPDNTTPPGLEPFDTPGPSAEAIRERKRQIRRRSGASRVHADEQVRAWQDTVNRLVEDVLPPLTELASYLSSPRLAPETHAGDVLRASRFRWSPRPDLHPSEGASLNAPRPDESLPDRARAVALLQNSPSSLFAEEDHRPALERVTGASPTEGDSRRPAYYRTPQYLDTSPLHPNRDLTIALRLDQSEKGHPWIARPGRGLKRNLLLVLVSLVLEDPEARRKLLERLKGRSIEDLNDMESSTVSAYRSTLQYPVTSLIARANGISVRSLRETPETDETEVRSFQDAEGEPCNPSESRDFQSALKKAVQRDAQADAAIRRVHQNSELRESLSPETQRVVRTMREVVAEEGETNASEMARRYAVRFNDDLAGSSKRTIKRRWEGLSSDLQSHVVEQGKRLAQQAEESRLATAS